MNTQDGYDWPTPHEKAPDDTTMEGFRILQGGQFLCELRAGETWCLHPAGGVIIAHPERKPVWYSFVAGGARRREVLEV